MDNLKQQKTDRRSRYTRMVIKDAMLELLAEKDYADITVTALCQRADISRGTFYLHFDNTRQVMDQLFDDALSQMPGVLEQLSQAESRHDCAYPLCLFLRCNKKYQALFFSDQLHAHVIDRLTSASWDSFSSQMAQHSTLSQEVLKALFCFRVNGCLAVCKSCADISDEAWKDVQCGIDSFLRAGLQAL